MLLTILNSLYRVIATVKVAFLYLEKKMKKRYGVIRVFSFILKILNVVRLFGIVIDWFDMI
jgi:hypothetical protein